MTKAVNQTLTELNAAGFKYNILQDVFKMKILTLLEVEIILRNLVSLKNNTTPEIIIMMQCVIKCKQFIKDPSILIDFFETNKNESIRNCAGIVLVKINTVDLSKWFQSQLLELKYSFYKLSLLNAIPEKMGFNNDTERLFFIKQIFDVYHAAPTLIDLFKKYGTKADIPYLEAKSKLFPNNKSIIRLIQFLLKKE